MSPFRALLVDDEAPSRDRMRRLLAEFDERVEIVGEAGSVAQAAVLTGEMRPDLLFLDIRLGDGDAFDLLRRLDPMPQVIFVTAYSEYAHKAFEHRAVDYLLKPVTVDRLASALARLPGQPEQLGPEAVRKLLDLASTLAAGPQPTSFPVRLGDRTLFVRFADITHFEAREKLVYLHTMERKSYPIDVSLTRLMERLPGQFVQVHRAFVVNRDHIAEVHRFFGGKYRIVLGRPAVATVESGVTYKEVVEGMM